MKSNSLIEAVELNSSLSEGLVESVARLKSLADHGACTSAVTPVLETVLTTAVAVEQRMAQQDARIAYLESLSVTDEVTGLFNRRGFDTEFDRTLARARRSGEHGLLVLCDLDRFKAINDTYGHPAGDAVLRGIADVLRNSVRDSDVVARLGGDEFGMILIDADPTGATQRMGPLRTILDGFLIVHDDHYIPVSGSLGYAAYGPNSDAPTVTALADKALYRSKERR